MKEMAPKDAAIEVKQVGKLMRRMEGLMDSQLESLGFFIQRQYTKKTTITLPEIYELMYAWTASIWEQGPVKSSDGDEAQEGGSNQDEEQDGNQSEGSDAKKAAEDSNSLIKEVEEEYHGSQPSFKGQAEPSRNQRSSPHKSSPDRNKKDKLASGQTEDPN